MVSDYGEHDTRKKRSLATCSCTGAHGEGGVTLLQGERGSILLQTLPCATRMLLIMDFRRHFELDLDVYSVKSRVEPTTMENATHECNARHLLRLRLSTDARLIENIKAYYGSESLRPKTFARKIVSLTLMLVALDMIYCCSYELFIRYYSCYHTMCELFSLRLRSQHFFFELQARETMLLFSSKKRFVQDPNYSIPLPLVSLTNCDRTNNQYVQYYHTAKTQTISSFMSFCLLLCSNRELDQLLGLWIFKLTEQCKLRMLHPLFGKIISSQPRDTEL